MAAISRCLTDQHCVRGQKPLLKTELPILQTTRVRSLRSGFGLGFGLGYGGESHLHTNLHACTAGLSGMRCNESRRDPVESERVITRSCTHATCHKTQASQLGIQRPCCMWVPPSHPLMCEWPLYTQCSSVAPSLSTGMEI